MNLNTSLETTEVTGGSPDAVNWATAVLTLRADLKLDAGLESGVAHIAIEDPIRQKFFRVGEHEYQVLALIDGSRTGRQLVQKLVGLGLDQATAATRVQRVIEWLVQHNLAVSDQVDNARRLNLHANRLLRNKRLGWLNPISIRIPLFNPNRLLESMAAASRWLFSLWFLIVWLVVVSTAVATIWGNWTEIGASMRGILSGHAWFVLLALWLALKIVHELAHGLACKRFGGEVPQAGVLLLLFTPMAFVDVTSMWRFQSRWQRMVVSAAGMYVEGIIASIAILVWSRSTGQTADLAFQVALMASVTTLLFNANPLMRFDGYFLLSDLLGIPNLYQRGATWLSNASAGWISGKPECRRAAASESLPVKVYGGLAFCWRILICLGLMLAASVLFHGAGLVLSIVAGLFWFGAPLWRRANSLANDLKTGTVSSKRLAVVSFAALLVVVGMFYFVSAPGTRSAPALVAFSDEETLRAEADGFVRELFVESGQAVQAGQPLIRLENRELENELFELELKLHEARIQARIYRNQREHALAQAESENVNQLECQCEEKRQQVAGLTLVARTHGVIYSDDLAHQIGQFVNCGDPLLVVARGDRKQLIALVDQRDFDDRRWQSDTIVRALFPGCVVTQCTATTVHPRATTELREPSLAAIAGGPLAVRQASQSGEYKLLAPQFEVEIELPESLAGRLHVGQRGQVFFSIAGRSMGQYLFESCQEWLSNKLEIATGGQHWE